MSYDIRFTDSTKQAITVADSLIDSTTNLRFQGKNVVNFSSIIGENFLHLLENFASQVPPSLNTNTIAGNPVAGQLWYNTTPGTSQLMVYDGVNWAPSGGLYKGISQPPIGNNGDLWVNTATQQLYLYTGSGWILVGPNYSIGQRTGPEPETIIDTNNLAQSVISNYVNGVRVAIISTATFTPKAQITGFPTINAGITLSSAYNTFWGTAEKASALVIGQVAVDAANFLRGDAASVSNFPLSIKNNTGISIGGDNHFSLSTNGSDAYIYNKMSGGNILVQVTASGSRNTVVTIDNRMRVGINNTNPQSVLDVGGDIASSGTISSYSVADASVSTLGGISVGTKLNVGTTANVTGNLTVGGNVVPSVGNISSIGTPTTGFSSIYATNYYGTFNGNLNGSFTGNISGSASKLASPTTFVFDQAGDVVSPPVSFDGQTGGLTKTFVASISDSVINNKPEVTSVLPTDEVMVSRNSALKKITTTNFFSAIPTFPIGCIMPYAGSEAPVGWLLCDGSEVSKFIYSGLWDVVQYNYGSELLLRGNNTFKLPDMRGRFPLGMDDMNNHMTVPSKDDISISIDALESSPAGRVTHDGASGVVGGYDGSESKSIAVENVPNHRHDMKGDAGTQFYGVTKTIGGTDADAIPDLALATDAQNTAKYLPHSGDMVNGSQTSTPLNVMNPWLGLNYIIYTGVI